MSVLVTPLIFLIHIAEEWRDFPAWATRHFGATSRAWYGYTHIVLVVAVAAICWFAAASPGRTMTILALAVQWGLFTNAVFHLVAWRAFKEYSPGVFSALFLFVPVTVWQFSSVTLDPGGFALAITGGTIVGGLAVASLWLQMDIDWAFGRPEK